MTAKVKKVIIAGGGITGLSAAFYLQKQIAEHQLDCEIILVEQSNRLGGKIQTDHVEGFVIEKGPDSFLARKPAITQLTMDLGLEGELVGTNPNARKNYILHNNRLHLMPPGLILGIPTQVTPFVKTGLISPLGKLRAGMDLFIPSRREAGDESLGDFLQRRLGKEVAENIAEPLLSGIYAGDTQVLSLDATFPQFKAIEQKYGSIIKGMLQSRRGGASANSHTPTPPLNIPEVAKKSMFLTFRQGLHFMVEKLVEKLDQVDIRLEHCITEVTPNDSGYKVTLSDGTCEIVDAVLLATPAFATKKILADVPEAELLSEVTYVSVANLALAYDRADIDYPLDASGFVVPRTQKRNITACTWTSSKWPQTTPDNRVLIRCYVGHSKDQSLVGLPDEVLLQKVRDDLRNIMGMKANPLFYRVSRWKDSMPQYRVGHLQRLQEVRQALKTQRPGVYIAGAGYQGVGIPDCVQQGKDAAGQLV
ncbi:MAG TPA: protoporphyrinogen oxidase, partial [Bacillota bacterium]|nr:protoporphyrinogen oxidase [Bacillota bacterium]